MASSTITVLFLILITIICQNAVHGGSKQRKVTSKAPEECDIYQGEWVYDASYPLYEPRNCPFILNQFDCQANARPDSDYLKLKWQPSSCDLPWFDGGKFLKRFRDKRLMFVGDSISLNQWQSLVCMLHTSVPNANYTLTRTGPLSDFTFHGYNVSLLFSRNAFLVDILVDSKNNQRVLKLDSISCGKDWRTIDVLIFNSWHWWLHTGHEQPWDVIQYDNTMRRDMDRLDAYEIALKTWSSWVQYYVDPSRTMVFFQGISPDHTNGTDWARPGETCKGQIGPVIGPGYPGGPHPAQVVVERVLKTVSKQVKLLNVTGMSQMRKDGHPSVYGFGGKRFSDCSHWCLAGVPDTWNLILYTSLFGYHR